MQFSVREAKAQFAHAANVAASGEKVVITKHGKPYVELVAVAPPSFDDLVERVAKAHRELGIDPADYPWPDEFNDPAFSKLVLGGEE